MSVMPWSEILGHDQNVTRFRQSVTLGRLASTFLFVGPNGVGKRTFAIELARALLCDRNDDALLEACGHCQACQQVAASTHPDVIHVSRPADKSVIPVELLIGDRDHRMSEGLCHDIALKPYSGRYKIAIIDDVDCLNQEGANCLLKTLEEPPPRSLLILVGTSEQRQLPTIRSRSQIVRFGALSQPQVEQLLMRQQAVESDATAAEIAALANGSIARALLYADPEMMTFRQEWSRELVDFRKTPPHYARVVGDFVDQAGKDASLRRARMKHVFEISAEFYQRCMVSLCGQQAPGGDALQQLIEQMSGRWTGGAEVAAACLERCLEAIEQVDANANQATLLECWIDDLQQLLLRQNALSS
ncbi:MAG TPA: AAA family ATPase [Planctomycetaceae bacterium]|nr:AAA family ATPase [Blastopirellula sp.]HAY79264.1 AAA family ATPase [Planctomycetaceae bacterium]